MEKSYWKNKGCFLSLVETMSLYKRFRKQKKDKVFMQEPLSLQQT